VTSAHVAVTKTLKLKRQRTTKERLRNSQLHSTVESHDPQVKVQHHYPCVERVDDWDNVHTFAYF